jgi:hypothetical protein
VGVGFSLLLGAGECACAGMIVVYYILAAIGPNLALTQYRCNAQVLLWYFHRMPAGGEDVMMLLPHEDKGALSRLLGGTVNKPPLFLSKGPQHVSEGKISLSGA